MVFIDAKFKTSGARAHLLVAGALGAGNEVEHRAHLIAGLRAVVPVLASSLASTKSRSTPSTSRR